MPTEVLVTIITGITMVTTTILTMIATIRTSKQENDKTKALIGYRIDQLEKKVNLHNNLIERTYKIEADLDVVHEKISVANHRIDDLEHK